MNDTLTITLVALALAVSFISLLATLRLSPRQRTEYEFFLREYRAKIAKEPRWMQRLASYNAALGGPSPKWHWIPPVLSPSDDAYTKV